MNATHAPIQATLQQALSLHRQGKFEAAASCYRQVLQLQPRHFDALHLLGVLARQAGRPQEAISLIEQALAVDATHAIAYCNLGAAWQDLGKPEEALRQYERALAIKPDYALALNNRGNALRNLQRLEDALLSYRKALQIQPDYADAFFNLGTVQHRLGRVEAALASYEQALKLKPEYADAWCNLGIAQQALHRPELAMQSYDHAIRIAPRHANAHCNRGALLRSLQRYDDALESYDIALRIKPDYADAHLYRGHALRALRRTKDAVAAYRRALEHGGDPEQIHYALAALGEEPAPSASPADYVKNLFDRYADRFDRHLLDVLQYQTPNMLVDMLRQTLQAADDPSEQPATRDSIDLGCGTGLCGPLLRPLSRNLSGVDLSPNMLEKASLRGVYDHLTCAELSAFLQDKHDCYDLAVAADVFVYLGDLSAVFHRVGQALRNGGLFGFSVEAADKANADVDTDFTLRASHRYAHTATYLKRLAQQSGFTIASIERRVLRHDDGVGIDGYLAILRKTGRPDPAQVQTAAWHGPQ